MTRSLPNRTVLTHQGFTYATLSLHVPAPQLNAASGAVFTRQHQCACSVIGTGPGCASPKRFCTGGDLSQQLLS